MSGHRQHRPDRVDRDTYRVEQKHPDGTHCPQCHLVVRRGRWTQVTLGEGQTADKVLCPACRRVRDHYPAGVIDLTGDLSALGTELVNLVRNIEKVERTEHPLERLMELELTHDGLHASTTGVHLARRIGSALERRLRGRVQIRYGEEENIVRIVGTL